MLEFFILFRLSRFYFSILVFLSLLLILIIFLLNLILIFILLIILNIIFNLLFLIISLLLVILNLFKHLFRLLFYLLRLLLNTNRFSLHLINFKTLVFRCNLKLLRRLYYSNFNILLFLLNNSLRYRFSLLLI